MKVLLINPPHISIGSRVPDDHLPPLGLLSVGGPLLDDGHEVKLLDADFDNLPVNIIIERALRHEPEAVLLGHSGSTTAQPVISEITRKLKTAMPTVWIIVGGVFPTYHWKEILESDPQIDAIVCGEGEETIRLLIKAFETNSSLENVKGIAFIKEDVPFKTAPRELIRDLNDYRVGWELMGPYKYSYWGRKPAVVVQFSRGCPYPCTYCGQSLFWQKWRHRDPKKFVEDLKMLKKVYGIRVINFADENPTTSKKAWKEFLEELIAADLNLILVGSTRADNIVRDADILHLYKKAGFERFLLGMENYDEANLKKIQKAGSTAKDREAIRLLRKHNILSMATYVVGFSEEKPADYFKSLKHLISYDPDQVQMLYVTPHRWTPFYLTVKDKKIIQPDQRKWDYKHQVLETKYLSPWMVILFVKLMEVIMQLRPKVLKRRFFHPDLRIRDAQAWYYKMGKRVWFREVFQFMFSDKILRSGPTVKEFWETSRKSQVTSRKNTENPLRLETPDLRLPKSA